MPPKLSPGQKFAEGERVLCFHGPLLYEAKVTKVQVKDKLIKYFVHYQGWNKSWDEWVPETRVLKFNDANLERQKELAAQSEAAKKKKKQKPLDSVADVSVPSPTSSESRSGKTSTRAAVSVVASTSGKTSSSISAENAEKIKKLKVEPQVEPEAEFTKKVEIKIHIPDELKAWLVDDWDQIVNKKKLLDIPAKYSVEHMLESYLKEKQKGVNKFRDSQYKDVVDGIREYFNAMLGCQLLYKFERPQYQKLDKTLPDDLPMSSQYGVIHLVRLFVKLGSMLIYTDLDEKDMSTLLSHIQDFLQFIVKSNQFSIKDYVAASPDYVRKVQT